MYAMCESIQKGLYKIKSLLINRGVKILKKHFNFLFLFRMCTKCYCNISHKQTSKKLFWTKMKKKKKQKFKQISKREYNIYIMHLASNTNFYELCTLQSVLSKCIFEKKLRYKFHLDCQVIRFGVVFFCSHLAHKSN